MGASSGEVNNSSNRLPDGASRRHPRGRNSQQQQDFDDKSQNMIFLSHDRLGSRTDQRWKNLSAECRRWVQQLSPVLSVYDYDCDDIVELVNDCAFDPVKIQASVDAICEEKCGHEQNDWQVSTRKSQTKKRSNSPPKGTSTTVSNKTSTGARQQVLKSSGDKNRDVRRDRRRRGRQQGDGSNQAEKRSPRRKSSRPRSQARESRLGRDDTAEALAGSSGVKGGTVGPTSLPHPPSSVAAAPLPASITTSAELAAVTVASGPKGTWAKIVTVASHKGTSPPVVDTKLTSAAAPPGSTGPSSETTPDVVSCKEEQEAYTSSSPIPSMVDVTHSQSLEAEQQQEADTNSCVTAAPPSMLQPEPTPHSPISVAQRPTGQAVAQQPCPAIDVVLPSMVPARTGDVVLPYGVAGTATSGLTFGSLCLEKTARPPQHLIQFGVTEKRSASPVPASTKLRPVNGGAAPPPGLTSNDIDLKTAAATHPSAVARISYHGEPSVVGTAKGGDITGLPEPPVYVSHDVPKSVPQVYKASLATVDASTQSHHVQQSGSFQRGYDDMLHSAHGGGRRHHPGYASGPRPSRRSQGAYRGNQQMFGSHYGNQYDTAGLDSGYAHHPSYLQGGRDYTGRGQFSQGQMDYSHYTESRGPMMKTQAPQHGYAAPATSGAPYAAYDIVCSGPMAVTPLEMSRSGTQDPRAAALSNKRQQQQPPPPQPEYPVPDTEATSQNPKAQQQQQQYDCYLNYRGQPVNVYGHHHHQQQHHHHHHPQQNAMGYAPVQPRGGLVATVGPCVTSSDTARRSSDSHGASSGTMSTSLFSRPNAPSYGLYSSRDPASGTTTATTSGQGYERSTASTGHASAQPSNLILLESSAMNNNTPPAGSGVQHRDYQVAGGAHYSQQPHFYDAAAGAATTPEYSNMLLRQQQTGYQPRPQATPGLDQMYSGGAALYNGPYGAQYSSAAIATRQQQQHI